MSFIAFKITGIREIEEAAVQTHTRLYKSNNWVLLILAELAVNQTQYRSVIRSMSIKPTIGNTLKL